MTTPRLSSKLKMLETCSDPTAFKRRRTSFARIDGVIEAAEVDWSLSMMVSPVVEWGWSKTARAARF